jgi:hypothetical protein
MVLMKLDIQTEDLIDLLALAPGTKEDKQRFLATICQARVPRTNYDGMWQRLAEQIGRQPAAQAVLELVLQSATPRVRDLITEGFAGQEVLLRPSDPRIVDFIFFQNGRAKKAGIALFEYLRQRQRAHSDSDSPPDIETKEEPQLASPPGIPSHVYVEDLLARSSGPGIQSAPKNHGWRLQRVTVSKGTYLKASSDWSEAQFESHLVASWQEVDFGDEERLLLIARQVRLKRETREKVDLLARTDSGLWIAIELKSERADGRDFTQLQSYMQDLVFSLKVPQDRVHGYLLAPGFQDKVLNAAAGFPRIKLLEYIVDD